MNNSKKILPALWLLFVISLSFFIFGLIYENQLPKLIEEINNSAIGAILTAIITVLLLSQQSSSEELKERNVRVFEEKSQKYNLFIEKLWEVWDDREVSLEEMDVLIKMLSKDIVLYSKPATVSNIATCLANIAERVNPEKSHSNDKESLKIIKNNILDIINLLAQELGLGSEINDEIREKINLLEDKIIPYVRLKEFKTKFIDSFIATIENNENHEISKIEYKKGYLWCQIKNSAVYVRVGSMERENGHGFIAAYVEFYANRNYTKYRDAARGWRKDLLQGTRVHEKYDSDIINFKSLEDSEKLLPTLNDHMQFDQNKLALIVINEINNWRIQGKTLSEVIDLCEKKEQ
jgi:hypothetical protein